MDAMLMGILPPLLALLLGNGSLLLFGALFSALTGGDFILIWLLRTAPGDVQVVGHPSRVGCVVII